MTHGDGEPSLDYEEFLYTAIHDLRAPLNQVHALTTLLARRHKDRLEEAGVSLCGHIESAAEQALAVVDALHAYAQIGECAPFEDVEGESVLRAAELSLEEEIRLTGAEIEHQPLPRFRGDRRKLIALFRELISNALKFRGTEPVRVMVDACPAGSSGVVSVRDNGVGIPPEKAEAVFQPFKRLRGHDYPGTGMGLTICRRIVHLHNGRIWVEPSASQGAELRFSLPLADPAR